MPKTNLWKIINTNFNDSIIKKKINYLDNKYIAIDANYIIMSSCIAYRKMGVNFTNINHGKKVEYKQEKQCNKCFDTSHIKAIVDNVIYYTKRNISPIYVFDGKYHILKAETIQKRKLIKEISKEKCKTAQTMDEYLKYYKRTVELSKEKIQDIQRVLDYMGIPYIQAIGEADPQLAAMTYRNEIYGVVSEDIDILLFGGSKLIRRKKDNLNILELEELLKQMSIYLNIEIDRERLIDLVILLGCEYSEPVKKITLKTLVNTYKNENYDLGKTINSLINLGYKVPKKTILNYQEIKNYFINPTIIDPNSISIKPTKPSRQDLLKFLVKYSGFSEENSIKIYSTVFDFYKKKNIKSK